MTFQGFLLLTLVLHSLVQHRVSLPVKLDKLSKKESKEITNICGRHHMNPGYTFPWSVRITVCLDRTADQNGDYVINQCAGLLLSNRHILSVAHCFFNYKMDQGTGPAEFRNKIFTNLSNAAPTVELGWLENENPQFISKRAKVGAWHQNFRTNGRKDIPLYYSYYNWALLQLEEDLSMAYDTAQLWKNGRIVPICIPDPETKPEPSELSVFGFGQHDQCPDGESVCMTESKNTIVDCDRPNSHSTCINLTTPGAGCFWEMPKSGIWALMAMVLYKDHLSNIIRGTRLKTTTFKKWIKDWLNLETVFDQPIYGSIVLPMQPVQSVTADCSIQRNQFKSGPMHCKVDFNYVVEVKIGEQGVGNLYKYLMLLDTGSERTMVWSFKTKFFKIANNATQRVLPDEFFTSPVPRYLPQPKYKSTKIDHDSYGVGDNRVSIDLDYYDHQTIDLQGDRVNMKMGLIANYTSSQKTKEKWQGMIGLSLGNQNDTDNNFMVQFIKQKPTNLRGIVSIDIGYKSGKLSHADVAFGTSLRQLTSKAVIVPNVDQSAYLIKKWIVNVESVRITFPNGNEWTKDNVFATFDTGAGYFLIPSKYHNEIDRAIEVTNPEPYLGNEPVECNQIMSYMPIIQLNLLDKDKRQSVDITIYRDMMYDRHYSQFYHREMCTIKLRFQNNMPNLFLFGNPFFGATYVEFNYETEEVTVDPK